MEIHEPLFRILRKGYQTFQLRRITEAVALGLSVLFPSLLGALLLGLLLGTGRFGAWLVPTAVAVGAVAGLIRAVRFGLRHHIGFGSFLLSVERRAGLARNELVNALQLGRRASTMDDPLARDIAREVLRRGEATARRIPFRSLAPACQLRGPLGQAFGALALVVLLGILAPGAVLRTAGQVLHPGHLPEPTGLEIVVEPGDCQVVRGSSLPVRARLSGIEGEPTLFHRAGGGAWQRMPMQADSAGFTCLLSDLQAETEYAVSVDRYRSKEYLIRLLEPLRATGYEKRTHYPAYTGLAPERELSPHGSITALTGSTVELLISISRPEATGRIVFDSGSIQRLEGKGESVVATTIEVRKTDLFRVELESTGAHDFSWVSEPFHLDPIADAMPNLYLLAPGEQVDLPADMQIVLEVDCTDDFGITRLDLVWQRNREEPSRTTIDHWEKTREARVLYPWNLEGLANAPGDLIIYRLALTDNDTVSGPKTTLSPEYTIRFPTIEEMYAQQEEDHRAGMEDMRESLDNQIEIRHQLERIAREIRQDRAVDWEQKQEIGEFLERQEEILQKMENLAQGLDQQLDRMQQGELFSPEILSKIAQIQDLVRQIQSPEFREQMERLRQAMESLDPNEVRKALEEMKLTQEQLEQGLDRTLQMLEHLLAEEQLDELIQRAERLLEEQNQINEQTGRSPDGQPADSTQALSQEQSEALRERQDAAQKELEELRKQMEELAKLASESHQEMAQQLESQEGSESKESLDEAQNQMSQSSQAMSNKNRKKAGRSGKKASSSLRAFVDQMKQMQDEMESDRTKELSRRLLALAGNLVDLSQRQEELVESTNARNSRDLALEQSHLERAGSHIVDQVYELARETPFISIGQARALSELLNHLGYAANAFETGRKASGAALGRQAGTMMDEVVADLLQSNQNMCSSASSSCNNPNPSSMMQGLSSQQQGVNQGTQELFGQMQGERLQQGQGARLEQLAAQQERIRDGLREVAGSMGNRRDLLGRLDELGKEMEEVVEEMRNRNVDERILRRQERILSRLLTAQRSLRRQDYEEQRRSRTGVDPTDRTNPDPLATGLSRREQIQRGILKGSADPIPEDFRRVVEAYFRALMEESP